MCMYKYTYKCIFKYTLLHYYYYVLVLSLCDVCVRTTSCVHLICLRPSCARRAYMYDAFLAAAGGKRTEKTDGFFPQRYTREPNYIFKSS